MASSVDFAAYIAEQIAECGDVSHKKMFGEYMVYLNAKPIFLVCNDTLYVKCLDVTDNLFGENAEKASPYNGAKPHYIVSAIDDGEFMRGLALALEKVTPVPKPKKKK